MSEVPLEPTSDAWVPFLVFVRSTVAGGNRGGILVFPEGLVTARALELVTAYNVRHQNLFLIESSVLLFGTD
jgi:hypothetical protein